MDKIPQNVTMDTRRVCPFCGNEMESIDTGWKCMKCKCYMDAFGHFYKPLCPIKLSSANANIGHTCEGEKCSWWLDLGKGCAVPIMAGMLVEGGVNNGS